MLTQPGTDVTEQPSQDPDHGWKALGACREYDAERWFAPSDSIDGKAARDICLHQCGVREQCAEYALATPERWGIWGGLSESERNKLLREHRQATAGKSRQGRYTRLTAGDVAGILARLDAAEHLDEVETATGVGREVCRRVWREHRNTPNPPRRKVSR